MNMTIRYNQSIPACIENRRGRNSVYREPCMKIIAGDANNAMMSFDDKVQASKAQCAASTYIKAHSMNLLARRDGRNVYIFRAQ